MMTWKIDDELITDGSRLVGSIVRSGDRHFVEIMWSGNDMTFEAKTRGEAEAFVRGVEALFQRVSQT